MFSLNTANKIYFLKLGNFIIQYLDSFKKIFQQFNYKQLKSYSYKFYQANSIDYLYFQKILNHTKL